MVVVSSPLAIPADVDGLEVVVVGDVTGAMVDRTFDLSTDWPHSVSIRPGAAESQGILVLVTATKGGAFVARRVVRSRFVRGEQTVVNVLIPATCVDVHCTGNQDCAAGRCVDVTVADGGVPDGGIHRCMSALDCDDGVNCTNDMCDNGNCTHEPNDRFCQTGRTCDLTAGCPPRACTVTTECADGVVCNGIEQCNNMLCEMGMPVDCNDADDCTTDRCDEAMRGMCTHSTRDMDGDGHGDVACPVMGGVAADDCNDNNPDVLPGAVETCNGVDDDCNGTCDDAFTCCRGQLGSCTTSCGTTGTRVCGATCSWELCSPPPETCNGADDDCNGAADDVFACVQGSVQPCTTTCGSMGTRTCQADCTLGDCVAPTETCNGRDDDCNGTPDDGFACVAGSTMPCTTSCGSTGTLLCDTTTCTMGTTCNPPAEGCNGVDDNCDGRIDETTECAPGTMQPCTTTCGSMGMRTCSAMCMYGACMPPPETCNGLDDNCDGRIDETFMCVPGSTAGCTTGCGTAGMLTCTASCTFGACMPPVEQCNGADDNCNGMCDETFTCCVGSVSSCTTSCGTTGTHTCNSSCGFSICSPPPEVCNGVDDDCNAACDDGFACCAGTTGSCTTSCGSTGSRVCSPTCAWGTCTPPPEACGNGDDNCNGMIDEGFTCSPGQMRPCTTSCGTAGTQTCDATCNWPACTPPAEACNGVDDNCNAMVDEGCGSCFACAGSTAITPPGGRYNVTLGPHVLTGSCGGAGGSEGYLTFTIGAISDVFITTHQALTVDTVLYVRDCMCAGTERACNDDADGRTTSMLRFTNLPAGTYNIVVDTKSSMSGTIPVDVYITTPGMPSDRCGNPTRIAPATTSITGTTCGYGSEYLPTPDGMGCYAGSGAAPDRVYYFVVPAATTVSFAGCASGNYDETIFVRDICTDNSLAAQRACNDDCATGVANCTSGYFRSTLAVALNPGLYYFMADGYQGAVMTCAACGNYTFTLTGI